MRLALLSTAFVIGLVGCASDPDTPDAGTSADAAVTPDAGPVDRAVTLRFRGQVGTQPFACGQMYGDLGADRSTVTPVDFRFYVSEVKLLGAGGAETPLALTPDPLWQHADVALVDFEDGTGACETGTADTRLEVRGVAPAGTYTGLRFTIGVPEALNHLDLIDSPAPLDQTALWWSWNLGHIFFAAVTRGTVGTSTITHDHFVHVGSTGCNGDPALGEAVTCSKANRAVITLDAFDADTQTVVVDFAGAVAQSQLMRGGCHSFGPYESCDGPFGQLGMSWRSGQTDTATQAVFRVE